jgi:hypothetical protein
VEQGLTKTAPRKPAAPNSIRRCPADLTVEAVMTGGTLPAPVDLGPQATQSFLLEKPLRDARDEFEKPISNSTSPRKAAP